MSLLALKLRRMGDDNLSDPDQLDTTLLERFGGWCAVAERPNLRVPLGSAGPPCPISSCCANWEPARRKRMPVGKPVRRATRRIRCCCRGDLADKAAGLPRSDGFPVVLEFEVDRSRATVGAALNDQSGAWHPAVWRLLRYDVVRAADPGELVEASSGLGFVV